MRTIIDLFRRKATNRPGIPIKGLELSYRSIIAKSIESRIETRDKADPIRWQISVEIGRSSRTKSKELLELSCRIM